MSATRTARWDLRALVGVGDSIGLVTLPFLVGGVLLNMAFPATFDVGGPPVALRVASILVLVVGVTIWLWSVALILSKVPRGVLLTAGPFALVKHPIYTAVALLVLPWAGFLVNTWLGAAIGVVVYVAARTFEPAEERALAQAFGSEWQDYSRRVTFPWL